MLAWQVRKQQRRQREKVFQHAEGALSRKKILKEHIVVDKIRKETIQRLKREGVSDQYLVELMQLDPSKFQS